jgi:hypothetical protein
MKKYALLLALFLPLSSQAADNWYRDAGDYIAHRSVRQGLSTDTSSKILTDFKRYDAAIGKRVALLTWAEKGSATAWTAGVDAGMLASLQKYSRNGQLTFATNTFDGFFGAFISKGLDGWNFLLRVAHLSAHLVDNSPNILTPNNYSQFWEELIVGKTFPNPEVASDWEVHLQGNVGLNHTSVPVARQPRAGLGVSATHLLADHESLSILGSADVLRAGVNGQRPTYSFFLGLGTMNRPNLKTRPFRIGVSHFRGSDYRNQSYNQKQKLTMLELGLEL